jgi:aldehyde:ferredoxin oxidoreductase
MDQIVHINTRSETVSSRQVLDAERTKGGRAFIAHYLRHNVNPACDSLGRHNPLIVAAGLLGDTPVTTAGRWSIGAKSPLTSGVKEANTGGYAGTILGRLGIRAVILEDAPDKTVEPGVVFLSKDVVRIDRKPDLAHLETKETIEALKAAYGPEVGILCIGPAGEMGMAGAAIATNDHTGQLIRFAARGGLGAVMGSKGIKALVFDPAGTTAPVYNDRKRLMAANKGIVDILRADPKTENRNEFGTPAVLSRCNSLGILPTRNFSSGSFEHAQGISGERIRDLIVERGGRKGLPCVPGCAIQCSNVFRGPDGSVTVATLQYENITLLGSNCGIGDIDQVAELNHLCNQVGVDAIETGAALAVAMEAGLIPFGDGEGAKDLVRQIGRGTPLGRILGNGVVATGRMLNVRRVPAIKGQAIAAYDPRALKGIGVTYVMSPMGADHTAGNALETAGRIDPLGTEGQVESSYRLQVRAAILDSLGVCLFIRPAFVSNPELAAEAINGRFGWEWTYADVQHMGIQCLEDEREFNNRSGASDRETDVPEFMREEPLPPTNAVFDITREQLDAIWEVKLPADVF